MGKIYGNGKMSIAYLGRATDIDAQAVRLLHKIAECWKNMTGKTRITEALHPLSFRRGLALGGDIWSASLPVRGSPVCGLSKKQYSHQNMIFTLESIPFYWFISRK